MPSSWSGLPSDWRQSVVMTPSPTTYLVPRLCATRARYWSGPIVSRPRQEVVVDVVKLFVSLFVVCLFVCLYLSLCVFIRIMTLRVFVCSRPLCVLHTHTHTHTHANKFLIKGWNGSGVGSVVGGGGEVRGRSVCWGGGGGMKEKVTLLNVTDSCNSHLAFFRLALDLWAMR